MQLSDRVHQRLSLGQICHLGAHLRFQQELREGHDAGALDSPFVGARAVQAARRTSGRGWRGQNLAHLLCNAPLDAIEGIVPLVVVARQRLHREGTACVLVEVIARLHRLVGERGAACFRGKEPATSLRDPAARCYTMFCRHILVCSMQQVG